MGASVPQPKRFGPPLPFASTNQPIVQQAQASVQAPVQPLTPTNFQEPTGAPIQGQQGQSGDSGMSAAQRFFGNGSFGGNGGGNGRFQDFNVDPFALFKQQNQFSDY